MTRGISLWSPAAARDRCSAADIAIELEMPRVLVPPHPASSRRPACLPPTSSTSLSRHSAKRLAPLDFEAAEQRYAELSDQARRNSKKDGVPESRIVIRRLADCRYAGQGYEVRFDVPAGEIDEALGGKDSEPPSTTRTRPSTATDSTPKSRSSTSASSPSA